MPLNIEKMEILSGDTDASLTDPTINHRRKCKMIKIMNIVKHRTSPPGLFLVVFLICCILRLTYFHSRKNADADAADAFVLFFKLGVLIFCFCTCKTCFERLC